MAAKTDMVNFGADIDIEQLISEGMAKHQQMTHEANEQANTVLQEATERDGLNLNVESIDMFRFQDQDFRNVRRNFQEKLAEKLRAQIAER